MDDSAKQPKDIWHRTIKSGQFWDRHFMRIAHTVAERSTCDRACVGALLVRDHHVISMGYNGAPRGLPHCDDVGHLMIDGHCKRTVHAELNAIIQVAIHGGCTKGTTCYCTHFPCVTCTMALINAGISRLVYMYPYDMDSLTVQMLAQANVMVTWLNPPVEQVEDADE